MPTDQVLADLVIEMAIERAQKYVTAVASYSRSSEELVELAKLNYAAYVAYQSYSD